MIWNPMERYYFFIIILLFNQIDRVMISEATKEMIESDKGYCEYRFTEREELVESKASDKKIRAFFASSRCLPTETKI